MYIEQILNDHNWDTAFYKKLAHNDTGQSAGHQAGIVIPQVLRPYFPFLWGITSQDEPTREHYINAILMVDSIVVGNVYTRYQEQTWGNTRSPETRLTGNLGSIRNKAHESDYLLIQKHLFEPNLYRLSLVRRQNVEEYKFIEQQVGEKRWGYIGNEKPISIDDLNEANREQKNKENETFELFDKSPKMAETRIKQFSRSIAFRHNVIEQYGYRCCVCRLSLRTPNGNYEVEAAHVVPRSCKGTNDTRNGFALCRVHHWAFDNWLFTVDKKRKIYIPKEISDIPENAPLAQFHGKPILDAKSEQLRVSEQAFSWHREKLLPNLQN